MSRTITPTIVIVNATVTEAPQPSTYQQSGAFVSVGGTTLTPGTFLYCGNLAAVQAIESGSGNHAEIDDMATTFFAQQGQNGNVVGVYVLELGTQGSGSAAITALQTWDTANPNQFYGYLTPATWDAQGAQLQTFANTYASPNGKKYFFVTTTQPTISAYANTKSIFATVPSPTAAGTEFQAAAMFFQWLVNNPSASTPVPPMAFRFLYGVTPWAQVNNLTTITEILTAFGNIVYTGAEGGISTACLFEGTTMDGQQAMFWWAVDWLLINGKLDLANDIINGSNSNNPIYYNQAGINRLQATLEDLGIEGISFGLLLAASFAAESFASYTKAHEGQYNEGIYDGFSCVATPQTGFLQIEFTVDATQFATA